MLKLEIGLNNEQILKDNEYELDSLLYFIDKVFASQQLEKENSTNNLLIYLGKEPYHDFSKIFTCVFFLEKQDWFMKYVDVWNFYDNGRKEDILRQSKAKILRYGKVI